MLLGEREDSDSIRVNDEKSRHRRGDHGSQPRPRTLVATECKHRAPIITALLSGEPEPLNLSYDARKPSCNCGIASLSVGFGCRPI
jgi:hypothetical protein